MMIMFIKITISVIFLELFINQKIRKWLSSDITANRIISYFYVIFSNLFHYNVYRQQYIILCKTVKRRQMLYP
jgi:hypothetical protein